MDGVGYLVIVLGIDPGSRQTGFGVIHVQGDKLTYVDCGVVSVADLPFVERLQQIYFELKAVIERHQVTTSAIEKVFMHKNADAALKLGHARGVAQLACVNQQLAVAEYTAKQIKQSVVGTGAADKTQVAHMVRCLLGSGFVAPTHDATDALAVAICHAHAERINRIMQKRVAS